MGAAPFSLLPEGIGLLLIQISLILVVCRALSGLLKGYLKQPGVVAEVMGGILLGKSCLGRIPGYMDTLFPASSMPGFSALADFGLCLYLFLVGLELDPPSLARTGRSAVVIAVSGIALPFALGVGVALVIYRALLAHDPATADVPFATLACFTGVAMSITAFPVLARILTESKLLHSPIGRLTLSAAAFNDAIAWCLLAITLAMVDTSQPLIGAYILLAIVAWGTFLFFCVRPFLALAIEHVNRKRSRSWRNALLCLVFVSIFVSSWATAAMRTDAIFGAFMLGVILPRDEALIRVVEQIEGLVLIVFLPMYFTLSGLNTNVASINSLRAVGTLALVVAAAVLGKLGACYLSGRLLGLARADALALGILMNTRGLMELIILNVALRQHVINEEAFSIMVLMAVATTFMTTPLIRSYYPKQLWEQTALQATAAGATQQQQQQQQQRAARLRTLSMDRSTGGAAAAAAAAAMGVGGSLGVLVPSHDPQKVISGLYLLLPSTPPPPAPAPAPRVVVASFTDAISFAAVLGERVGAVRDSNAREILLAARLFGAEAEAKQVLAPSPNVGPQLVQLLQPAPATQEEEGSSSSSSASADPFDFVLLPWEEEGGVDFERSMYAALDRTEATFVLLRDRGLPLPRIAFAPRTYTVGVVLFEQQPREGPVLELAALLHARRDVRLHVLAYRGLAPQTAELLESLKLGAHCGGAAVAVAVAASEDELLALAAGLPLDLLVYGFDSAGPPCPHASRRNTRGDSGGGGVPSLASSTTGGRGSLSLSIKGLRLLPSFHHHRSSSSGGSQPLLQQDAHDGGGGGSGSGNGGVGLGGGNGGGGGGGYRAMDARGGGDGLPSSSELHQEPTPRALMERLCSRLDGVHAKRVSVMEVHGGRGAASLLQAIPGEEQEEQEAMVAASAEEGAVRA